MNARLRAAAAVSLAFLAADASAHGVTPTLDAVAAAVEAGEQTYADDPVRLRAVRKMAKLLDRRSAGASLAGEIAAVAAAARLLETRVGTGNEVADAFTAAVSDYTAELSLCRTNALLASSSPSVSPRNRRRAERALARLDAALGVPGKIETPLADLLRGYAAAARASAGLTPYDGTETHRWVLSSFALAGPGTGVDLDGDREPDNALAQAQSLLVLAGIDADVAEIFEGALTEAGPFLLLELWGTRDLSRPDPFAFLGLMNADDGDGDPLNDFSGSGTFAPVPDSTLPDGHPVLRAALSVGRGGKFSVSLRADDLPPGPMTLPVGARVVVQGVATGGALSGHVGVVLPLDAVRQVLADAGIELSDSQAGLLALLADIDTDHDGSGDAVSGSFAFEAVSASVAVD